jgi:hypothetical protein
MAAYLAALGLVIHPYKRQTEPCLLGFFGRLDSLRLSKNIASVCKQNSRPAETSRRLRSREEQRSANEHMIAIAEKIGKETGMKLQKLTFAFGTFHR